jgi:uncharacterized protein with PIN domain
MAPLRFYFDTNVAKAAADQLRVRGVDVIRCEEVGMAAAKDIEHLQYATDNQRVLVSHDQDFLRLDQSWKATGKRHAGIFFLQQSLQGDVGFVLKALIEYADFVEAGAATLEADIIDQVQYIG